MKLITRQKLNWTNHYVVLIVAAVIGLILQSWIAFFLTAGVLFYLSVRGQKIRLSGRWNW